MADKSGTKELDQLP